MALTSPDTDTDTDTRSATRLSHPPPSFCLPACLPANYHYRYVATTVAIRRSPTTMTRLPSDESGPVSCMGARQKTTGKTKGHGRRQHRISFWSDRGCNADARPANGKSEAVVMRSPTRPPISARPSRSRLAGLPFCCIASPSSRPSSPAVFDGRRDTRYRGSTAGVLTPTASKVGAD